MFYSLSFIDGLVTGGGHVLVSFIGSLVTGWLVN